MPATKSKKVERHLDDVEIARQSHRQHISALAGRLSWLDDELREAERQMQRDMADFNNRVRSKGRIRLIAFFDMGSPDRYWSGPLGPHYAKYQLGKSGETYKRTRMPAPQTLSRHFEEPFVPYQLALRDRLKAFGRVHAYNRGLLQKGRRVIDKHAKEVGRPGMVKAQLEMFRTAWTLKDIQRYRTEIIESMAAYLEWLIEELVAVETELDGLITKFNGIGRRRQGAISVSWEIPSERRQKLRGPHGPFFSVIWRIKGRRVLRRINTLKDDRFATVRNQVTERILEKQYLGRFKKKLLPLNDQIVAARAKRDRICTLVEQLHKALETKLNLKGEVDDG